jgi:hypothetical protein
MIGKGCGSKPTALDVLILINWILKNTSSDEEQIVVAIFGILDKFISKVKIEDDITSVIIKMQD